MNTGHRLVGATSATLLAVIVLPFGTLAQTAPGLPEPGLVMYGPVTNVNGNYALVSAPTVWRASGVGSSVTITSTVAGVNGQYFHITRIPFETRSVSGQPFTPTANTLPLTTGGTFTRSATVKGQAATIVYSSRGMLDSFTFGPAERGLIERVHLTVNIPGMTYEDWLALYPGLPADQRGSNDDPDHDGASNAAELHAGTNPTRGDSVFRFVDLRPDPDGSLWLLWSSVAGKTYAIERSEDLGAGFTVLQAAIPATPGTNTFHDATATGVGPYFYRLTAE